MFRIFYIIHNLFSKSRVSNPGFNILAIIVWHDFQFLKDWVLALAVGVLVAIDIFIIIIFTVVEAASGDLDADLQSNDENIVSLLGVRIL